MKEFYSKRGILHQKSYVNAPQQKGTAKRKHIHILEISKSLFFQSGLPIQYWGECVLSTVIYLIKCHYQF